MSFEVWGIRGGFYLQTSQLGAQAWLLIAIYAAVLLGILWRTRREWAEIRGWRLALFVTFVPAAAILSQTFLARFDSIYLLAPPGLPEAPKGAAVSLFGGAVVLLGGAWLGTGPAALIGFAAGAARAGWGSYNPFIPFETALLAALAAYLIRQRYQGKIMAALRQPVVAGPLSALCIWPLRLPGLILLGPEPPLAALDYALANMEPILFASVLEFIIAGAIVQLAYRWLPTTLPSGLEPTPWQTGLGYRMLFSFLPISLVSFMVIISAVTVMAFNISTHLVVAQMARDAEHVTTVLPFFTHTGANLLRDLAGQLSTLEEPDAIQAALRDGTRAVPFFWQLYYAQDGTTDYQYPNPPEDLPPLTRTEREFIDLTLATGMPQDAFLLPTDTQALIAGFIVPVRDDSGVVTGAILGRTSLDVNPVMKPMVSSLRSIAGGRGTGFVIDQENHIILHPSRPDQVMQPFLLGAGVSLVTDEGVEGITYRRQTSGGALELVYVRPIPGTDGWSVVILTPNLVVLEQAVRVAAPLAVLMGLVSLITLTTIYIAARRIARPITQLARTADYIAGGDLTCPITAAGVDEVGRLGASLTHMRDNLIHRLDEQTLLLQISQAVSADLDFDGALPPILTGCLRVTGAAGARIVLDLDDAPVAYYAGAAAQRMAVLDHALLDRVRTAGRLVIPNRADAQDYDFDISALSRPLAALVALPLRHEKKYLGVLWLGYRDAHAFSESTLRFLETLAGQVTITVVKAQLYETARSRSEQLEVVLNCTGDAVLAADRRGTLMMVNPAAAALLGVDPVETRALAGRPVEEAVKLPALAELLQGGTDGPASSREIIGEDGRVYASSASQLKTPEGRVTGWVVVLHDITHLKEIDELKDDFVQIVSHDLRSPLTYMRGYATMLGMVGELNDKQQGFADKIVIGIEQMSSLIDNVLDIGRLESGGELERDPCDLTDMVEDIVTGHRAHALTKRIELKANFDPDIPVVMADEHMLRQAITNLVDNAIKYTPEEGEVAVEARLDEDYPDGVPHIVVSVSDNGPGISKVNQAHLFEKFYRVRKKENVKVKGSGLGLTIVKGVAQRHGGDAWVESELGEGSTFYISIAVVPPGAPYAPSSR